MTWSGMLSPFGGEPQGLYTGGKPNTSNRKACQSLGRGLAGRAPGSGPTSLAIARLDPWRRLGET